MCTLINTLSASSSLSFEHNHLGLSGNNQMPTNCISGMRACSATGTLQAASPSYPIVPNTVQAATMEPTYHRVLYIVVILPRCWGCAS